jgi:HEAT repeat protein
MLTIKRRAGCGAGLILLSYSCSAQAVKPSTAERAHALEVLQHGAADRDPDTRRQVALALSLGRAAAPVNSMVEALVKDSDSLVRQAALDTVGELGDRKLAPVAEKALNDEVAEVVFAAARALYRLHDPAGKSTLIAVVEKEQKAESNPMRIKLRTLLRRMKTPRSALFLAVEQGVGFVPVPGMGEGVSAMSALLNDDNFSPRATSLLLLAGDPSADVRMLIEQAFADEDWSLRAAAVQLVTRPQNARWRPRLASMVDDSNKKVRFRAAAVYLRVNR